MLQSRPNKEGARYYFYCCPTCWGHSGIRRQLVLALSLANCAMHQWLNLEKAECF